MTKYTSTSSIAIALSRSPQVYMNPMLDGDDWIWWIVRHQTTLSYTIPALIAMLLVLVYFVTTRYRSLCLVRAADLLAEESALGRRGS